MLGLRFMRGLSLVAASGGHSSSRCTGLSLSRPLLLRGTGSRCAGSVVVAHGPNCSAACGIFPDQGSNPGPLHWQADSQPLRHQGSPQVCALYWRGRSQGQNLRSWENRKWESLAQEEGKFSDNFGGTGISSRACLRSSWSHQTGTQLPKVRGKAELGNRRTKEKASTGTVIGQNRASCWVRRVQTLRAWQGKCPLLALLEIMSVPGSWVGLNL